MELPGGGKVDEIYTSMINAEAENKYSTSLTINNDPYTLRALPYNVEIRLYDGSGKKYMAWIVFTESDQYLKKIYKGGPGEKYPDDFREEEIYKVFQTLDKNLPATIIYKVDPDYKKMRIIVQQGNKEFVLNKVTVWLMNND